MKKIKNICIFVLSLVLLGCLAACGSSESSDSGKADKEGSGLVEMDVVLDWYPNAIHTFLYDAADKGYFEEEGIKVNLISPAESVDALTFVSSKKARIGLTYPIETVKSATTGMRVRAIGAVTQKNLSAFTTLADSGITADLKTLKGKKVGYDGTASSEAMIRTAAGSAGLKDSDYEMVNVGFDLTTALTSGSVDITSGMMLNDEVVTMKNSGYVVNTLPYSNYGIPEMYDIVMIANDEEYQKNTELYNGFLRACYKGFQDMKASEEDSLEIIMKEMSSDENPLDEAQQRESYETLIPCMETDAASFLSMSDENWKNIIDWMKAAGLINQDVQPADIATNPEINLK